jgi:hypothetical protein
MVEPGSGGAFTGTRTTGDHRRSIGLARIVGAEDFEPFIEAAFRLLYHPSARL